MQVVSKLPDTEQRNGIECDLQKFYNCVSPILINSAGIPRDNLVNVEINHSDVNYKVTQQQKAVSVSELLDVPQPHVRVEATQTSPQTPPRLGCKEPEQA
eukprot:bmy_12617T0